MHIRLNDGTSREVDHVLLGTGYRVDVTRYPFLAPELSQSLTQVNGFPTLDTGIRIVCPRPAFSGRAFFVEFRPIDVFCMRHGLCRAASGAPPRHAFVAKRIEIMNLRAPNGKLEVK